MPSVKDLGESKYLAKEDVGKGKLVTIIGYDREDVSRDCDPSSIKYILKFKECKPLVLNKTNGKKIAVITGSDDFDKWIGAKIVLWNNPDIEFQGETTGGIRVRADTGGQPNPDYVGDNPAPPEDDSAPF